MAGPQEIIGWKARHPYPYMSRMFYVYILQSERIPAQTYIGLTDDVERRLTEHNDAGDKHTTGYRPWKLAAVVGFPTRSRAEAFEHYLKTGSGRAFAKRHLR